MNNRLQQFLIAENINQAQFADSIGVARASVSHILAGRNKPGYDFIQNMLKRYPDLNIEWLLTGQGKMYKSRAKEGKASSAAANAAGPVNLFDDLPDFDEPEAKTPDNPDWTSETIVAKETASGENSNVRSISPELSMPDEAMRENITLHERRISVQEHTVPQNIAATGGNATIYDRAETAVKQRKAVKIVIFYDDNTFQEF